MGVAGVRRRARPAVWTPPASPWRDRRCAGSGGSGQLASPSEGPLQVALRATCGGADGPAEGTTRSTPGGSRTVDDAPRRNPARRRRDERSPRSPGAIVEYLEGGVGDPGGGLLAATVGGPASEGLVSYYGDSAEGPGRWIGQGAAAHGLEDCEPSPREGSA